MEAENPRAVVGGNGPPPDRTFKKRWAIAIFARQDKPAGAVAMAFKLYMEMDSLGRGATISDAEFQVSCGVSDGSCRVFKRWLRDNGFIAILVRGRRGYRSEFRAIIPDEDIPADIAGIPSADYRRPIPVEKSAQPATAAAIPPQDAPACARIPARIEPPSGVNIHQNQTTTALEQVDEGGSGFDLDALNGTAVDLTKFIAKYAVVDEQTAQRMLANNIKAFTADAVVEAFIVTTAEMATGMIAKPYKYLIEAARGIKAKAKSGSDAKPAKGISRLKEKFLRAAE